jgi:hypothetical protein
VQLLKAYLEINAIANDKLFWLAASPHLSSRHYSDLMDRLPAQPL